MLTFLVASMSMLGGLPAVSDLKPVPNPYFPDALHAFVWRNWELVPVERMAQVVGGDPKEITRLGIEMGLGPKPTITEDQQRRWYITVIRRNWHLLPYDQMLTLLGWTEDELAYTLREDDFLYIKLGSLKPKCEPVRFADSDAARTRRAEIREITKPGTKEPLFHFIEDLSQPPAKADAPRPGGSDQPRFCSSYFTLYGDPLLDTKVDSYPDGYLSKLAAMGVNGVWMQAVLYKLAPFPWEPKMSEGYETRLKNLGELVERARKHGIGVYLYLNEPRAMQQAFHAAHPGLKGVSEGDYAAMCTSTPEVQQYIRSSVETICRAVPDLESFFTITASENLTSCWSHGQGQACPLCSKRSAPEVIAEVNGLITEGIKAAGAKTHLAAWDWGWVDSWTPQAIAALPKSTDFMSVSEWSLPISRGGVETTIGEYSISAIGPGPRAKANWKTARECGLRTLAKVQIGCTWELSSVPYIPAMENVALHAAKLRKENVGGLMLGWTLGGYPSPNMEVVAEMYAEPQSAIDGTAPEELAGKVMRRVAARRFNEAYADVAVKAWETCSAAFREFPFHSGMIYSAPMQMGPANPFWSEPTGYHATMVGLPYDDLPAWHAGYPVDIFISQFEKVAKGFSDAAVTLENSIGDKNVESGQLDELRREIHIQKACGYHFESVVNQCRFVLARDKAVAAKKRGNLLEACDALAQVIMVEQQTASHLYQLQCLDSRIGYEASNHYFYVPNDLLEKVVNCRWLLDKWLPELRTRAETLPE